MTPYQFSKSECANHLPDDSCLNAQFDNKLKIVSCSPRKKCVLVNDQRCSYFENCVLPMVNWVNEPRKAKATGQAAEIYRNLHKLQGSETIIRVCPGCGGELLPRKRYCPTCQIKRRKSTFRNSQNAKRQNGGQGVNS